MLLGGAAGVTVTSGNTEEHLLLGGSYETEEVGLCPLAADNPRTISSNFFLFFSLLVICSGAGCKIKRIIMYKNCLRWIVKI